MPFFFTLLIFTMGPSAVLLFTRDIFTRLGFSVRMEGITLRNADDGMVCRVRR
jgi:hypothetical protein